MNTSLAQSVQTLASYMGDVRSNAPELTNEFSHLVQVGNQLAAGSPTTQEILNYANAVQNFGNVLNASDDTLRLDIIDIGRNIAYAINAGNPVAPLVPGNPSSPLAPYKTPCSPGGSCSPVPAQGIYWTGILILAGMIGAAVVIGKVKG